MEKYTVLTKVSVLDTDYEETTLMALIEEQNTILESLGYDLNAVYMAHFFDSVFFNEQTAAEEIGDLTQMLSTKEGYDLVRFENDRVGFVAYYGAYENGFEIIGSYDEIKERVTAYITDIEKNYKSAFIAMWETCCDLCGWLDLDKPSKETMIDVVMDYNTSLFDDGLKKILRGGEMV